MERKDIFVKVNHEREYQEGKWGSEFDNKNTLNDWVNYICHYATKSSMEHDELTAQRNCLIKVAALAFAALEASYRNDGFPKRHYDK